MFVLGFLSTSLCLAPALAQGLNAASSDDVVSRWRLQVKPYASSDDGYSFGVYRRIGARWDLGVALSSSFSQADSDVTTEYHSGGWFDNKTNRHELATTVGLEVRRWRRIAPELGWFFGPRVSFGYEKEPTTVSTVSTTERVDTKSGTAAIHLLFGVDLRLLPHLSLTAGLQPLGATYRWEESEKRWTGTSQDDSSESDRSHNGAIAITLSPELFLCVEF
jgi:hypothetical protein